MENHGSGNLRVCIADDHLLMLHGVRDALLQAGDIDVVGLARSGVEVIPLVEATTPDLVLLDHRMPGVDGVTCLREIKRRWPQIQVVMLSASEDPQHIEEALSAGASAYIGKRINPGDLASALRQVVAGVVYQRTGVAPAERLAGDSPGLTMREQAILEAMAEGLSTKVISRELCISEKTVKFHLTNVYRKLGVHNRTGAMRYAYEHDLIRTLPQAEPPDALSA
jgi:DNA-binding NarL/FixJ family response regulator